MSPHARRIQLQHRFSHETRGVGRNHGVDVFRDLIHSSCQHEPRRIFEGYTIVPSWRYIDADRVSTRFNLSELDAKRDVMPGWE